MMIGLLVQWPTLPTLVMFPVLIYRRLASSEESEAAATFGQVWRASESTAGRKPAPMHD